MRANGEVIDKENGYMNCPGDGAQPEFELALFRYRDGRPLLALCFGELEGTDSVQLQFFELGADGRMQQISQPILPGAPIKNDPGMGYVKESWQFELPRKGCTILVRSEKTKKILHKFTWSGENLWSKNESKATPPVGFHPWFVSYIRRRVVGKFSCRCQDCFRFFLRD